MNFKKNKFHKLVLVVFILLIVTGLFFIGVKNITIDTDIISTLPQNDPVVSDAKFIFSNHPIQDNIAIDISLKNRKNADILIDGASFFETELEASKLFNKVGMQDTGKVLPEIVFYVLNNMPILFSKQELEKNISPLLNHKIIYNKLKQDLVKLHSLEGIGQGQMIAKDPLEFKNLILKKLSYLIPTKNVRVYRNHLMSLDQKHVLVTAKPKISGTDTKFARKLTNLIQKLSISLNNKYSHKGYEFSVVPVGAFRAALDNELMARKDTQIAILLSTICIALLLIFSFYRPYIGLLAFLPAVLGTMMAFFVYSIFYKSISILAIGFGGAIISITIDHGLTYLIFIDRPYKTYGRKVAKEVWAIGLLAAVTTVGAFFSLSLTGFPVLKQIGQFAAFGIIFSFIFVHSLFPLIFSTMPAAKRKKKLPLIQFVDKITLCGGKYKLLISIIFMLVMLFFAKPNFYVDLKAMNSVTESTKNAQEYVTKTWGNVFSKVFLLTQAKSIKDLQNKNDKIDKLLEKDVKLGNIKNAFCPSMLFPGSIKSKGNYFAWKNFWTKDKVKKIKHEIISISEKLGYSNDAFEPFFKTLENPYYAEAKIPKEFFDFLGIIEKKTKDQNMYLELSSFTPKASYNAEASYIKYTKNKLCKMFHPAFFSKRLGQLLFFTFSKMIFVVGIAVIVILFIFFLDIKLTLIALLPIIFSFICTFATLNFLNHPLDIPSLMLAIVVIGMGVDYSLYLIRAYQRYGGNKDNESLSLVRMAVFLASTSTIIGFGALNFADHALLKSAGLTSLLGIVYALIGSFCILPPILSKIYNKKF